MRIVSPTVKPLLNGLDVVRAFGAATESCSY